MKLKPEDIAIVVINPKDDPHPFGLGTIVEIVKILTQDEYDYAVSSEFDALGAIMRDCELFRIGSL